MSPFQWWSRQDHPHLAGGHRLLRRGAARTQRRCDLPHPGPGPAARHLGQSGQDHQGGEGGSCVLLVTNTHTALGVEYRQPRVPQDAGLDV